MHALWERVLSGEVITIPDNPNDCVPGRMYYPSQTVATEIRKALMSLTAFWENCKPEVVVKECLLYSLKKHEGKYCFPYAGRVDLVAWVNGELYILDIKTSRVVKESLSYNLQLTMYMQLWNDMHPEMPATKIGAIHAKKDWMKAPPKSVLEPIEYRYEPDLVTAAYKIFQRCYDGFDFDGGLKIFRSLPKTFSLSEAEVG